MSRGRVNLPQIIFYMVIYSKEEKKEVGKRLKEFGLKHYNTLSDFARALDVEYSYMSSNYFAGRSLPGMPMLAHLLKLGCDLEWLFLLDKKNGATAPPIGCETEVEKLRKENQELKLKIKQIKNFI